LILLHLFAFSFFSECNAQSNLWKLDKDNDGIKVYVRAHEGSDFDEFKATLTIQECSLNDALKVLLNIDNLEEVNSSLTITYQFKGNPGGEIPAWPANAFVVSHPYETLTNFKKLMD
jgi:hypothetical protein